MLDVRRREFITLLGAAAAWPVVVRAQGRPIIGLLNGVSNKAYGDRISLIREGLQEFGFIEGRNLAVEYRSAEGQYDRLPALANDLVGREVAAIVCIGGTNSPRAAKAATSTIPIVFAVGNDPVESGLVASLNRPGSNITGVSFNNATISPKRLELLRELVPKASLIGALLNPYSPNFDVDVRDLPAAARNIGRETVLLKAGTEQEIDTAFANAAGHGVAALVVENDAYFSSQREQIVGLAARYGLPAVYGLREAALIGGLMSYAPKLDDLHRQVGIYVGRILKGEKPADLPVQQPTKFELVINLKTAKALGLTVPNTLLVAADEVIE
jgi:putative tryptophan/tyrosine transport system substrate-binding protein